MEHLRSWESPVPSLWCTLAMSTNLARYFHYYFFIITTTYCIQLIDYTGGSVFKWAFLRKNYVGRSFWPTLLKTKEPRTKKFNFHILTGWLLLYKHSDESFVFAQLPTLALKVISIAMFLQTPPLFKIKANDHCPSCTWELPAASMALLATAATLFLQIILLIVRSKATYLIY